MNANYDGEGERRTFTDFCGTATDFSRRSLCGARETECTFGSASRRCGVAGEKYVFLLPRRHMPVIESSRQPGFLDRRPVLGIMSLPAQRTVPIFSGGQNTKTAFP